MVRYTRRIYQGWFVLISVALVLQFYLAGYSVFAFSGPPPSPASHGFALSLGTNLNNFDAHRTVGGVIHLATLLGVGLAFAARVPWRLTGINFGLFVLVTMQYGLATAGTQGVAALHVVNGVLIFVAALYLTWQAVRLPLPATAPAGAAVVQSSGSSTGGK